MEITNNPEQTPFLPQALSSLDEKLCLPEHFNGRLASLQPELLFEFCQRLPKVELHYHVEGGLGVRPESLLAIAQRHELNLPAQDVETLRPHLQITPEDQSLLDFIRKFDTIGKIFVNQEVISEIFATTIREAALENVRYLELRFSPLYMALAHDLHLEEVMAGVIDGVSRGQEETGVKTNLIMIAERQMPLAAAWLVFNLAVEYKKQGVVALDLANDEFNYPPGPFAEVFRTAKQEGLKITVHAGEAGGPENVRTAIEELGADRIGHGVRAYLDAEVEELVRRLGIPLELCLTSNTQTQAVADLASHPIRHYFDRGIKVTVNTDDPGVSAITHSVEFYKLIRQFNFTLDEVETIVMNGVDAAFVSEQERRALRADVSEQMNQLKLWLAEVTNSPA